MSNLLKQFEEYFKRFDEEFGSVYVAETEAVVRASKHADEFAYPLLHLELPTIRTQGTNETANARYKGLAWVIVKLEDYESRNEAFGGAIELIQTVIKRMREDAYEHDELLEFTYDVEFEPIRPLWVDDAIGWEFNFSILMPGGL
ncbi:hypothetical protein BWI97_07180 [Siphonobacter sp. BAB-5405]|uniref:hypothetical protein n=1 Tax=Siphonobacter sp. BAB-5405 TaxID=1864825 RepID=UPI000C809278|nr:hypothetical protein [Siphonobacter sp. BAB-5405]PMD97405.1 hypothetical protein BWI97_07180 [Siphonobacter sp. BAB-5405]